MILNEAKLTKEVKVNIPNYICYRKDRTGDFNCPYTNQNGKTLLNFILSNDYMLLFPDKPTHFPNDNTSPTTIDVALIN